MLAANAVQPQLFGTTLVRSRSPYQCRHGGTTKPVRFASMTKRQAGDIMHRAREFERSTRRFGRQDGRVTRNGLAVLQTLLFDFLNFRTGRLDPSHASIARKAGIAERSVRRGLAALKACGIVNWLQRLAEAFEDGAFVLRQETNAYAVLSVSQWIGFRSRPAAPPPDAGTWGDHPPLPCAITQAMEVAKEGYSPAAVVAALEGDERNEVAASLARLLGSALLRGRS